MTTTTNFEEFGTRERSMVIKLLQAWEKHGLPSDFSENKVRPMMNMLSGNVFLTNSDCEVAMMNGSQLESYYNSPYEGMEGFWEELAERFDEMHDEDQQWFRDITKNLGKQLPETKQPNKN